MRAYIVVDLGFGDSGKGLLTDFLCRHLKAGVVVRYNGGAQAGHNVVLSDGRHHTFSQFGSGTFIPGVKTYLSQHVAIHPGALLVEGSILEKKGVPDAFSRLRISGQALIITPFHQAANRIKEILRGADRHGSCGVGVGEAVEDKAVHPEESVLAQDLAEPNILRRKLRYIRAQKRQQLLDFCRDSNPGILPKNEWQIFEDDGVIDSWISSIARITDLGLVIPGSFLGQCMQESETVIYEGAQGVLLDADEGFHPYTTWSRSTDKNALELIAETTPGASTCRIGVLRSCAVRHGPGPLPTQTNLLSEIIHEHNEPNQWQGTVRYGWFDAVLSRYALEVNGGIDYLAVTHMDALSKIDNWKYCSKYQRLPGFDWSSVSLPAVEQNLTVLPRQSFLTLERREQLTKALFTVEPFIESCSAADTDVIQKVESLLSRKVNLISKGPAADDIQILESHLF